MDVCRSRYINTEIPSLTCPSVIAEGYVSATLGTIQLDPYYFGYEVRLPCKDLLFRCQWKA